MSGPLVSASAAFVAKNSRIPPYAIEQSLRFDSGQTGTLTRTPSSNGGSVHTTSAWIKASDPTLMANIFASYPSESAYGTSTTYDILGWYSEGPYSYIGNGPGNESALYLGAIDYSYKFRDTSAWYHVIWVSTSTQFEIYVNGVLVASKSRTQNNSYYNQNKPHRISAYRAPNGSVLGYINCYMAEVHFVDGTALDPTDLGEYDEFGVWRPIAYSGSYGTNGYYLKFDETAANGIGHDHSGNGNNWTASGFTTSGAGTDVMSDTPTNNHCTWNSLVLPSGYSSTEDGNLVGKFTNSANGSNMPATFAVSSGKWYWETTLTATGSGASTGVALDTFNYSAAAGANYLGGFSSGWAYEGSSGNKRNSPTNTSYGSTYTTGDIIGIALDMDAGKIWWSKNGTWQASGDPAVGTNEAFSNITGTVVPAISGSGSGGTTTWTLNAGQRDFAYTPPTGFKALNTSNLPAPSIKDGSDYFNTVLWTGNATARDITTGHNSNFTWIKHRSSAENHNLYDILRGTGNRLESNSTSQETNYTDRLTAFNTDGFSLGTGYNNTNGTTYVGWSWAGGGTGSSNTDGSITSTVSANLTAGFSIVQFDGTGANGSIGHGLGVAPSFIVAKSKTHADNWFVYHSAIGPNGYIMLNQTAAVDSPNSTVWQNVSPTSTVFYASTGGYNDSGQTIIAYCFAEVEGYSKFGSYTGNGSSDGPFVFTGMTPAFILVKQSSGGENWLIFDTTRKTYNVTDTTLSPNVASAEVTSSTNAYDILSNGFKARNSSAGVNQSGQTYIFAAFAENPFGGSGVNPATAR